MILETTVLYERGGETHDETLTIDTAEDDELNGFTVHEEGGVSFHEGINGQRFHTLYVPEHRLIEVRTVVVSDDE